MENATVGMSTRTFFELTLLCYYCDLKANKTQRDRHKYITFNVGENEIYHFLHIFYSLTHYLLMFFYSCRNVREDSTQ